MLTASYKDILNSKCILTPSQLMTLEINNKNTKPIRDLLDRKLSFYDNGKEVGSINYISKSTHYFIRAKALQEDSLLPDINNRTSIPIRPQVFNNFCLKEGDILISKDSNIGESIILDKNYPNHTISGALYKLPITKYKYYLLAFLKHSYFKKQLDLLVPKGSTIRHAKNLFLDCKIPFPNQHNADKIINYIESLTQAIINKEKEIRIKNKHIFELIEKELMDNQLPQTEIKSLKFKEILNYNRLDTGLYNNEFKKIESLIHNYRYGYFFINRKNLKSGNTPKKRIIDTKKDLKFQWITPTNISDFALLINNERITCIKNNLNKNSLLIINRTSRGDSGEFVGMTMFYNIAKYGKGQYNQGLYCISDYSDISLCFMGMFLNSPIMRKYCANLSVGSKMKELKTDQIIKIPFPKFPEKKKSKIALLYHNNLKYTIKPTLEGFIQEDKKWNISAGIIELYLSLKNLKEELNNALNKIVEDKIIDVE